MALLINDDCTACDACVESCPNKAITAGNPLCHRSDPVHRMRRRRGRAAVHAGVPGRLHRPAIRTSAKARTNCWRSTTACTAEFPGCVTARAGGPPGQGAAILPRPLPASATLAKPCITENASTVITHLAGTVLAAIGAPLLIVLAARSGDAWKIVGCSIYGAALFLLYGASTLYHSLRGRAKTILRKLDHCSIYLLIAGTYTPFALVTLRGAWGWTLFGLAWGLAALGIAQEFVFGKGARRLSIADLRRHGMDGRGRAAPARCRAGRVRARAGCSPADCSTPAASFFTCSMSACATFTACGTCSCSAGSAAHFIAIAFYVV